MGYSRVILGTEGVHGDSRYRECAGVILGTESVQGDSRYSGPERIPNAMTHNLPCGITSPYQRGLCAAHAGIQALGVWIE